MSYSDNQPKEDVSRRAKLVSPDRSTPLRSSGISDGSFLVDGGL